MTRKITAPAIAVSVLVLAGCVVAAGPPLPLGFGPILDQVLPLLFAVIVAMLIWKYFAPWFRGTPVWRFSTDETAETTVRERYARGEISRDVYFQMLDDLKKKA